MLPEYTEEISLGFLKPKQYYQYSLEATEYLHWQMASTFEQTIMCHTPGGGRSYGESVTIRVEQDKVIFHSRAVNEYYWPDDQNKLNAENFKKAVAAVIQRKDKAERNLDPTNREKFGALLPSKTYLITPILIYLNVLVFVCMVIGGISPITPAVKSLADWGGNFRSGTAHGEWWRLLTYMFLHSGILHLVMNIYALLYIGMFLEPLLGKFRFIAAYLLSGVCAGLLSVTVHSYTVAVGASGAIFGMYGVFLAVLTTNHIGKTMRNTMLRSILFFVLLNLLYGMQGNIDNAAHIGGLLSGITIGYVYYPGVTRKHDLLKQALVTLAASAGVVLLCFATLPRLTDDIAIYRQRIPKLIEFETLALQTLKMDSGISKEDSLYDIKERGIYYWNQDINLLSEMEKLSLPPALREHDARVLAYWRLRVKQYELMYKNTEEGNGRYNAELKEYERKIDSLKNAIK